MLTYEKTRNVADIIIDDVRLLSQHNLDLAIQLRDAIWRTSEDTDVKVVRLRTDAPDFCPRVVASGIGEQADSQPSPSQLQHCYYGPLGVFQTVCYAKKIVLAEVNGECAGAGALLAMYADLTVASSDASFWNPLEELPEASLLMQIFTIGQHRAKSWSILGGAYSADTALEYGLINRVAPRAELRQASQQMAAKISKMPLDAVVLTKMGFNGVLDGEGLYQELALSSLASGQFREPVALRS